jgi:hypothetical protein
MLTEWLLDRATPKETTVFALDLNEKAMQNWKSWD